MSKWRDENVDKLGYILLAHVNCTLSNSMSTIVSSSSVSSPASCGNLNEANFLQNSMRI